LTQTSIGHTSQLNRARCGASSEGAIDARH
jgi:hypothetical protein